MDLIVMQCTLQKRIARRLVTTNQESFHQSKITPIKNTQRKISTTSPQVRFHSQVEKKDEEKGVGCDLFECAQIPKTFQFNMPQIDNFIQSPLISDKKMLKKKNGLIIFKPTPKELHHKSFYQSSKNYTIINNVRKRDNRLKKMLDIEIMKSSLEKEKLFTDKNCRMYLNDLWVDTYFQ